MNVIENEAAQFRQFYPFTFFYSGEIGGESAAIAMQITAREHRCSQRPA